MLPISRCSHPLPLSFIFVPNQPTHSPIHKQHFCNTSGVIRYTKRPFTIHYQIMTASSSTCTTPVQLSCNATALPCSIDPLLHESKYDLDGNCHYCHRHRRSRTRRFKKNIKKTLKRVALKFKLFSVDCID